MLTDYNLSNDTGINPGTTNATLNASIQPENHTTAVQQQQQQQIQSKRQNMATEITCGEFEYSDDAATLGERWQTWLERQTWPNPSQVRT